MRALRELGALLLGVLVGLLMIPLLIPLALLMPDDLEER